MRGQNDRSFIPPLEQFINAGAHGIFQDKDYFFEIHVLIVIGFNTEEPLSALVMGCHGDRREELIDLIFVDLEVLEDAHGAFFHDILCAGTCCHPRYLSPDTFSHDRAAEGSPCNRTRMYLDDFMARGMTHRCLAFHHEFAAHQHLCPVGIFMTIEKLSCHHAAELLNFIDLPVDCLLENLIDNFEIAGKVCPLEAPGEIDIDIEIGDEDDRAFFVAVNFDQFLYVLDSYPCKIDADIR